MPLPVITAWGAWQTLNVLFDRGSPACLCTASPDQREQGRPTRCPAKRGHAAPKQASGARRGPPQPPPPLAQSWLPHWRLRALHAILGPWEAAHRGLPCLPRCVPGCRWCDWAVPVCRVAVTVMGPAGGEELEEYFPARPAPPHPTCAAGCLVPTITRDFLLLTPPHHPTLPLSYLCRAAGVHHNPGGAGGVLPHALGAGLQAPGSGADHPQARLQVGDGVAYASGMLVVGGAGLVGGGMPHSHPDGRGGPRTQMCRCWARGELHRPPPFLGQQAASAQGRLPV